MQFQRWLRLTRLLESFSEEQLEQSTCLGLWPDPLPDPLPKGESQLDGLERKRLLKLWEEDERFYEGRSEQDLIYFCAHGHWPDQACKEPECCKARFDEVVRRHRECELCRDNTNP
jgi:hypothetical protein